MHQTNHAKRPRAVLGIPGASLLRQLQCWEDAHEGGGSSGHRLPALPTYDDALLAYHEKYVEVNVITTLHCLHQGRLPCDCDGLQRTCFAAVEVRRCLLGRSPTLERCAGFHWLKTDPQGRELCFTGLGEEICASSTWQVNYRAAAPVARNLLHNPTRGQRNAVTEAGRCKRYWRKRGHCARGRRMCG